MRRPSADTVEDVFSNDPGRGETGAECEIAGVGGGVSRVGAGEIEGESDGATISSDPTSLLVLLGLSRSDSLRPPPSELAGLLLLPA